MTYFTLIFLSKENNAYLSPDEDNLNAFSKLNLNDATKIHRPKPSPSTKGIVSSNRLPERENGTSSRNQHVRRAKSAIVISKSMNDKQHATTIDKKPITVRDKPQFSSSRDKSHDTPRKQPRSARSARSARSSGRRKKLTVEEKERKKERIADIKKLK